MWLVDWEYSGMNDPMWDLGDLSVEAGFDHAQDEEMIRGYFGSEASPSDRGRIVIYKAMCDLLWTLWGLIQFANKNPVDDFWAYATNRFERCKTLMADPDFARHLKAVRKGSIAGVQGRTGTIAWSLNGEEVGTRMTMNASPAALWQALQASVSDRNALECRAVLLLDRLLDRLERGLGRAVDELRLLNRFEYRIELCGRIECAAHLAKLVLG